MAALVHCQGETHLESCKPTAVGCCDLLNVLQFLQLPVSAFCMVGVRNRERLRLPLTCNCTQPYTTEASTQQRHTQWMSYLYLWLMEFVSF